MLQSIAENYDQTKQLLDAVNEKRGDDVFVAAFTAVQDKETGALSSYAVWGQGVKSLLPRADKVVFGVGNPLGKATYVDAPWERVRAVVGELMKPVPGYPERWRVDAFPSREQLAALGKA
jgi:hypothetical protein